MEPLFLNRSKAGEQLAGELKQHANRPDVIVLALPRGGVPVGYEVARALNAPLDVFLVRKLGLPGQEELAMGAIATGGVRVINEEVVRYLEIPETVIGSAVDRELRELQRRERLYRGDRPFPDLKGRTVILVDDGLATGSSMRAAVAALKRIGPRKIVVAVPVAAPETCEDLKLIADEVVCAATPVKFIAVGAWYEDFSQTTDEEVRALLKRAGSLRQENSFHRGEP